MGQVLLQSEVTFLSNKVGQVALKKKGRYYKVSQFILQNSATLLGQVLKTGEIITN